MFIGFLLLLSLSLHSQVSNNAKHQTALRLKAAQNIGIVFSGGGARGLAHLGVLRALEEYGIQPKVVGGTSMGAIVGSVYAMGYSISEMDSIFLSLDYNEMFFSPSDRKYKSIFDKQYTTDAILRLSMKKLSFSLPTFSSSALPMIHLYNRLLLSKGKTNDFSELDKYFYCVATNLQTRTADLLDEGDLITSVLASSSFPLVFPPQKKGEYYYIDGGVINNFPVEEMRDEKYAVDFVIGIDVRDYKKGNPSNQKTKVTSNVNFSTIIYALLSNQEDSLIRHKQGRCDIYLHPEIEGLSTFDFSKPQHLIRLGYEKMKLVLDSLGLIPIQQVLNKKPQYNFLVNKELFLNISQVDIEGNFYTQRAEEIRQYFPKSEPKKRMRFSYIKDVVNRISNTASYNNIKYSFQHDTTNSGLFKLNLDMDERDIDYDLIISASYSNHYATEFMLGLTFNNFLLRNSYLSLQLISGTSPRYNFNYYLDRGAIPSLGLSSYFYFYSFLNEFDEEFSPESTGNDFLISFGQYNFMNRIFIKSNVKQIFSIESGLEYNHFTQRQTNVFKFLDRSRLVKKVNQLNFYTELAFDNLNNNLFPRSGFKANVGVKILDLQEAFKNYSYAIRFNAFTAQPVVNQLSFLAALSFGSIASFDRTISTINAFKLGGAYSYNVYNTQPFFGHNAITTFFTKSYIYSLLGLNWNILKRVYLQTYFNIASISKGQDNIVESLQFKNVPLGVGLSIGYDSPIGPFIFGIQYSKEDAISFIFRLGFIY